MARITRRPRRALPDAHPHLRLPVRPILGRWPRRFQARFEHRFWADPAPLVDPEATESAFAAGIGAVEVGGTFKITEPGRHPESDDLLLDHVELAGATIVDIGASDGTTSADLIQRMPNTFRSFVITDRYLHVTATRIFGHTLLFEPDTQRCILAFGRRCLAWPHRSRLVRLAYAPLLAAAGLQPGRRWEVSLLNPRVRALMAADPRISVRRHDVFRRWDGPEPDVIKVANVLRRVYFSDEQIGTALEALRESLPEGGHLLVVDNPYLPIPSRAGLYRRQGDRFAAVALTDEVPEINDLVLWHDPEATKGRQEMALGGDTSSA